MRHAFLIAAMVFATTLVFGSVDHGPSYSFELDSVAEGHVTFRAGESLSWKNVGYSGGWFLVFEHGVRTAQPKTDTGPLGGILVKLSESETVLSLSCRAASCTVFGVNETGESAAIRLEMGESTAVSAADAVKIAIAK